MNEDVGLRFANPTYGSYQNVVPHAKLFPANPSNNNWFQKPVLKMG